MLVIFLEQPQQLISAFGLFANSKMIFDLLRKVVGNGIRFGLV